MGTGFAGAAAGSLILAATAAEADTIYFGQFGSDLALLGNTVAGVTAGGTPFTLTSPGNGNTRVTAGVTWNPTSFSTSSRLLYDDQHSLPDAGPITIVFASPIRSITHLSAEPNIIGGYTATLSAYDGATLLGVSTYFDPGAGLGTIPSFSFSAPDITSVVIDTTDDGTGFALGGNVPEPSTWTLMVVGLGGVGAWRRARPGLIELKADSFLDALHTDSRSERVPEIGPPGGAGAIQTLPRG